MSSKTQRERFEQYMEAPCSEYPANDHGRNDPHRMAFEDWGVPAQSLFWLWQAAEAAALERAIDKLLDMANDESTIEYKWASDAIRALAAPVEREGDKS